MLMLTVMMPSAPYPSLEELLFGSPISREPSAKNLCVDDVCKRCSLLGFFVKENLALVGVAMGSGLAGLLAMILCWRLLLFLLLL